MGRAIEPIHHKGLAEGLMCGIVGIAATAPIQQRDWLEVARDAMRHRGPDDAGLFWSQDGTVGLAHRRLAILDLSEGGHQPMVSDESQLAIVFNGEIYNHRQLRKELRHVGYTFRSSSDTEVILAAYMQWGKGCFTRLQGMFAIAIVDHRRKTLVLARDRAGEKPLFYHHTSTQIRFASELKALLSDSSLSRNIDYQALDCYLAMGYVPGGACILQGFNKLEAGHAASFSLSSGAIHIWRYWAPPPTPANPYANSDQELVEELDTVLGSAVARQIDADVPVALLLSGGVDSSLITAMAARVLPRVRTFTVGFKNHTGYDESVHAQRIASHFGTDHQLLLADEVSPELMLLLARQYDEPIVDSSMFPTFLISQLISKHNKVALGGDGADELFGGYFSASRMAWLNRYATWPPNSVRNVIGSIAVQMMPLGARGRTFVDQWRTDTRNVLPMFAGLFDHNSRANLLREAHRLPQTAESLRKARVPVTQDGVDRITRFDFTNYMVEDILVKVDRASMLNSLEIRSPFLDSTVIDFAFGSVPTRLKADTISRKRILRMLANKILPSGFDAKRKHGFGIPLKSWLQDGPWRGFVSEILHDRDGVFAPAAVQALFKGLDAGRPLQENILALAMFELWRHEYCIAL